MGDTRTPKSPDPLWRVIRAALPEDSPARLDVKSAHRWAVACSGGRDSMALLHAAACLAQRLVNQGVPAEVLALHVHHGLSPHADAWAVHVERACAQWADLGLPVRAMVSRGAVVCMPGHSLEAEARRLRHAALHDMAEAEGLTEIWLAHHQRDQAETFLLQALRGAGVKGLAAMPQAQWRSTVNWVRPWLGVPAADVVAYVQRHGLSHIEDESNSDTRWARNHLRHEVWPVLQVRFSGLDGRLCDAALHVADALPVLEAWAQTQLQDLGMVGASWPLDGWCARPPNERRLLLAAWYKLVSGRSLPASWLARLAEEWPGLHGQARPWRDDGLGLSLYRGQVSWLRSGMGQDGSMPGRQAAGCTVDASSSGGASFATDQAASAVLVSLAVSGPGRYPLPALGGVLFVREVQSGGLPAVPGEAWQLRWRSGGERWQAHAGAPARSLKKHWQSAGVPPWGRQGPLVWRGDDLLWVPGLGVDARHREAEGRVQWALAFESGPDAVHSGAQWAPDLVTS
jgi:tRNA(Ile)-lysidine synthase